MKDNGKDSAGYRVKIGIDYPPNRRAEPGDVVNDLPPTDIRWLIEAGAIEPVEPPRVAAHADTAAALAEASIVGKEE